MRVTVLRDSGSMRFRNTFIHKIVIEFLQPFWYFARRRGYPFRLVILIFIWFWDFGRVLNQASPFALICSLTIHLYWNRCLNLQFHAVLMLEFAHELDPNLIFNETWHVTNGPLTCISVILA